MRLKSYKILFFCLLATFIGLLLIYGRYIEPDAIELKYIDIKAGSIANSLKGKKIVHISDLHLSQFGKNEIKILKLIEQADPDLIFLTGDYIKWNKSNESALKFLGKLKARHGVFGVMGDYDYSNSRNSCLFCHEKESGKLTSRHNVIMLRDSAKKIALGEQEVCIIGVAEKSEGSESFKKLINSMDNSLPLLVLSHSPFAFDLFEDKKAILMFAGDTHGGQIKVPKWLYKLLGYEKNVKYNYGLFQEGEKKMYVTNGVGTSHFKFRLFCRPEVAVIRF